VNIVDRATDAGFRGYKRFVYRWRNLFIAEGWWL